MDSLESVLERMAPELAVLEERRQQALDRRNHAWTVSVILGIIAIVIALTAGGNAFPVSLVIALAASIILGAIIHTVVAGPAIREFANGFKSDLVRELIRNMAPGLEYVPNQGIPEEQFRATQLFATRPDRYHMEDQLSGRIGETKCSAE